MTMTHSEKAMATIQAMNTEPTDWRLATIIWTKENAFVPTKVKCQMCKGAGKILTINDEFVCGLYDTTQTVKNYFGITHIHCLNMSQINQWKRETEARETACRTCPRRRNYNIGTGEVVELVEREVLIGRVEWLPGTKFDSRFHYTGGTSAHHCELCAKGINQSNRVPVQSVNATGEAHGMWIGEDCARKILSVKANLKKDEFLQENFASLQK